MVFMAVLLPIGQRWIIKAAALLAARAATSLLGRLRADGSAPLNLRQTPELWTVQTGSGSLLSVGRARSMKLGF